MKGKCFRSIQDAEAATTAQGKTLRKADSRAAAGRGENDRRSVCEAGGRITGICGSVSFTVTHFQDLNLHCVFSHTKCTCANRRHKDEVPPGTSSSSRRAYLTSLANLQQVPCGNCFLEQPAPLGVPATRHPHGRLTPCARRCTCRGRCVVGAPWSHQWKKKK